MRTIELTRDEGEMLTDLLAGSGDQRLIELDREIRRKFGMITREQEHQRAPSMIKWSPELETRWRGIVMMRSQSETEVTVPISEIAAAMERLMALEIEVERKGSSQ